MLEVYSEGKDTFIVPEPVDETVEAFSKIFEQMGRNYWEPQMIPDKLEANRFRIERNDDHRVLCPRRAFNEKFVPFSNERILRLGSAIFDGNPGLRIIDSASTNFGEKLVITAKVERFNLTSAVNGVGDIEPSMIMMFNMASPMAKIAFSYKQLFCDNQIPSLASDPLSKILELDSKTTDDLLIENAGKLSGYITANVDLMLYTLELLGRTLINTRSIISLFSLTFGIFDIENERPKLAESLLNYYSEAPNAAPGTLLGGLNAITHYFAQFDHKTKRTARMSGLPTSGQNAKVKKAMRLVCEASKFDNANEYFDALY